MVNIKIRYTIPPRQKLWRKLLGLKPHTYPIRYTIECCGREINGIFRDEWGGMVRISTDYGDLIVDNTNKIITEWLLSNGEPKTVDIIKVDPDVLRRFNVDTLRGNYKSTRPIAVSDIPVGQHFWAMSEGELLVLLKTNLGCEVCGAWECGMPESDFEIIQLIDPPQGYQDLPMYYVD